MSEEFVQSSHDTLSRGHELWSLGVSISNTHFLFSCNIVQYRKTGYLNAYLRSKINDE